MVDLGDHCAYHLAPADWAPVNQHPPASRACDTVKGTSADVITLAAGEAHSVELDLSEPRWHVLKDGSPVEIGALLGFAQFRIEYRAPETEGVPEGADNVWRGRMASQAFNANGVVD